MARLLKAPAVIGSGALALWLAFGHGFVNYDTLYALVWGRDLAHGRLPDYDVPIAPTPHPLANLAGVLLSPLSSATGEGRAAGATAEAIVVGLAFVALAALGFVVYRLGALWFGPAAGALAAAIILTREPVLSFGARSYVDLPYVALVLAAVLVEARRPRAGAPVLALLAVAGLLRPEAWLFAAAYFAWIARGRSWREVAPLAVLAAAAPLVWVLSDALVTGNPLHSLTGTRESAADLERVTGIQNVPITMPRRIGEILREPVLVGAAGGGIIALMWCREQARLPAAAGFVAVGAFTVLATAGLPMLTRYLILPAAILAIFCGAGALGWLRLAGDDRRRRPWAAFGAVVLVLLAVFLPAQWDRLAALQRSIATQEEIRSDLFTLADDGLISRDCEPVSVPNHRLVPMLALWLEAPPGEISSALRSPPSVGLFVDPATQRVERMFILDPRDPVREVATVPAGFDRLGGNASWRVYGRCPGGRAQREDRPAYSHSGGGPPGESR
jgi:hypothetical protein